ncbi:PIN domain-containing protein [Salinibacter ruber]|uniref:PIN domain-containing protein n=1 Tax=Salinibacter ruber TaxID=146919 RepID=UPI003C6E06A4
MLDTNVLSEPVGPDPSEEVLTRLQRRGGEVALPSVARHELTYGAERIDDTVVDGWMKGVDAPT